MLLSSFQVEVMGWLEWIILVIESTLIQDILQKSCNSFIKGPVCKIKVDTSGEATESPHHPSLSTVYSGL